MRRQERQKNAHVQPAKDLYTALAIADELPDTLPTTSEWNFSITSAAPPWPPLEIPISALSSGGTSLAPSGVDEWNPFDDSFGDTATREEWDSLEGLGLDSSTPLFSQDPGDSGQRGSGEASVLATPLGYLPSMQQTASWRSQITQAPSYSFNLSEPLSVAHMLLESQFSNPRSLGADIAEPPGEKTSKFHRGPRPKPLSQRSLPTTKSPPESPLRIPTRYRTSSVSTTSTTTPYPTLVSTVSTASSTRPPQRQERSKTEQKYRSNLNNHFNALLEALPKELVESGDAGGRTQSGKPVSKIEVLDLAQRRILELERQQAELKEESAVLKGQTALFKRLFIGTG